MHVDQVNVGPNATYNGTFIFQGTETGSDFADFLLGIPSIYAQGDSNQFLSAQQICRPVCPGQLAGALRA